MSSTLKFLLDENIPKLLKRFLESQGHIAAYESKGIKNGMLASAALSKECILVSRDRDFTDSVVFPPAQFAGIIILTSHPPKAEKLLASMKLVFSKDVEFRGKLFIADELNVEIKS